MKRLISILLAVLLMTSLVISVNAVDASPYGVVDILRLAFAATGEAMETAEDVYIVAGNADGTSGAPDTLFGAYWDGSYVGNTMTKNDDGTYSKVFNAEKAYESVSLKVVKNSSEWFGDGDKNIQFSLSGAGAFSVTYNPADGKISVIGDMVVFPTDLVYTSVYAAGASVGTGFLYHIDWVPGAESNKMTRIAKDVWEITYYKVFPNNGMLVKFAIDGKWDRNFGLAYANPPKVKNGKAFAATWDGDNIPLPLSKDDEACNITLKLDLTNFNFATKTGAEITITCVPLSETPATDAPSTEEPTLAPVTEAATDAPIFGAPIYYVVGDMNDWQTIENYILTKNAAAEGKEYILSGVELKANDHFKVVSLTPGIQGGDPVWYPGSENSDYIAAADGVYDIYFRPNGDGGDDWFFSVIYVVAHIEAVTDAPATEAPATEAPATEAPATEAETDAPITGEPRYYVVGDLTNWKIDPAYQLTENPNAEGEFMLLGTELFQTTEFKVIGIIGDDESTKVWYPDGVGNNYGKNGEITAYGNYDIFFRPDGQGGEGWFSGVIFTTLSAVQPTAPELPSEDPSEELPDAYCCGDLDGDGVCTIFDVTYIQKWLAGMPGYDHELTPEQILAGDVDGDGEVSMVDGTYIQRYLVGLKDLNTGFWVVPV